MMFFLHRASRGLCLLLWRHDTTLRPRRWQRRLVAALSYTRRRNLPMASTRQHFYSVVIGLAFLRAGLLPPTKEDP